MFVCDRERAREGERSFSGERERTRKREREGERERDGEVELLRTKVGVMSMPIQDANPYDPATSCSPCEKRFVRRESVCERERKREICQERERDKQREI